MKKSSYKPALKSLQIELVKLQRHFIGCRDRILVVLEGRDAAGKDGTIKRIVEHLSPRETQTRTSGLFDPIRKSCTSSTKPACETAGSPVEVLDRLRRRAVRFPI